MRTRSRALAAWIAVLGGTVGAHRFYLHGGRDPVGWAFVPPALFGLIGLWRFRAFGQDDPLAALLLPVLGLTIAAAMLSAIVIALTPAERWAARFGASRAAGGWTTVLAAIAALLLGATALMSAVAFGVQRFFEWQQAAPVAAAPQVSHHRPT